MTMVYILSLVLRIKLIDIHSSEYDFLKMNIHEREMTEETLELHKMYKNCPASVMRVNMSHPLLAAADRQASVH